MADFLKHGRYGYPFRLADVADGHVIYSTNREDFNLACCRIADLALREGTG